MSLLERKSTKGSDLFMTPTSVLEDVFPYIQAQVKPTDPGCLWDPCAGTGNIVRFFQGKGYRAVGSDISMGTDFLKVSHAPNSGYTFICTNPPYSLKDQFIEKCYYFWNNQRVPFMLLLPITALEGITRQSMYKENGIQLLLPSRRVAYQTPSGKPSKPWFYSAWFTCGFKLKDQLTFMG